MRAIFTTAILLVLAVLFLGSSTLFILFDAFSEWNIPKFLLFIKPVPIYCCMALHVLIHLHFGAAIKRIKVVRVHFFILLFALFIGSCGDLFLLITGLSGQMLVALFGILSFLLGHLSYLIAFSLHQQDNGVHFNFFTILLKQGHLLMPYALFGVVFLLLLNTSGNIVPWYVSLAVLFYMSVSLLFVWRLTVHVSEQVVVVKENEKKRLDIYLCKYIRFFGCHLFVISDAMIALNTLKVFPAISNQVFGILIMVTYYLAQLMITVSTYEYANIQVQAELPIQDEEQDKLI